MTTDAPPSPPAATPAAGATSHGSSFAYLPGIDGLRALAVLAVIVYHGDLGILGGGFLGVEVFFVISGYLITSLLLSETDRTGGVSLGHFWMRRARRLLPALFALLIGVVIISATIAPDMWDRLRGDVTAAVLYVSNWWQVFHQESYFQAAGRPPLLRHLWSLAVEEQFYLGLFFLIFLTSQVRNRLRVLTIGLIFVWCCSAASVILLKGSTVRELFGTDTRASELVAGCLMAVVVHKYGWPKHRLWAVAGWIAFALTVLAWAKAEEQAQWVRDGGLLLISVLNIGLIGGALVPGSFATMLRWRPFVELGKISYPVYLVHWPIALLMSPERMGMTGWPLIIVRFAVTILIGWLISQYVERPFRRKALLPGWHGLVLWWGTAAATIAVAVASFGA